MPRWKKRPVANHVLRADDMRRHPRMWIEVSTYRSTYSANATARLIRTGSDRLPSYQPAGAFETRTEFVDTGTVLYARYTGGDAQ